MTVANFKEFVESKIRVVPLTVEQYHGMIEQRLLVEGDPIELLDGFLVQKDRSKEGEGAMTIGLGHVVAVDRLSLLNVRLLPLGCYVRTQQPLTLPPDSEPEPDSTIVHGTIDDYTTRNPGSADVICVIEVSDSSLNRDRTTKQRIYANAGITRYLIVNLIDKAIEYYRDPAVGEGKYRQTQVLRAGEQLIIDLGDGKTFSISVSEILP